MKNTTIQFDEIDLKILREIQQDNRISNSELARRIKLSQPATHTRIKRLETLGVIRQHVSLLNREALGLDIICFFQVRLQAHTEKSLLEFERKVQTLEPILECHYLTGQFDYLLKAVFRDRQELADFVRTSLTTLSSIAQITTSVVFSEVKSTTVLPLPDNTEKNS